MNYKTQLSLGFGILATGATLYGGVNKVLFTGKFPRFSLNIFEL